MSCPRNRGPGKKRGEDWTAVKDECKLSSVQSVCEETTTRTSCRSQPSLTRTDCPGLVFSQACHKIPAKTGCLSFRSINGSSCFNCERERERERKKFSLAAEQGKGKVCEEARRSINALLRFPSFGRHRHTILDGESHHSYRLVSRLAYSTDHRYLASARKRETRNTRVRRRRRRRRESAQALGETIVFLLDSPFHDLCQNHTGRLPRCIRSGRLGEEE